jgi:hypothetical protein
MKKAFLYSFLVVASALVSCQKEGLNPLKGVFPAATESTLTTLVSNETVKTESTREFQFKFAGEGGATLETVLVMARANYSLKAGSYVPGTTNGSFIASRTKVNGVSVTDQSGVIVVRNTEGSSTYIFEFALFDQAGNAYRSFWKGDIVYNPDPEPVGLNTLYVAQANTNNTVTVKVGTPGLQMDMVGTPSGTGYLFTADLYSPDGYLHEGTYTAATSDVTGEGQFTPGYAYDLTEYGLGIAHWGTCWWVDGEARDLSYGTVTIAKKGNKWVITWGEEATYPDWAVFEGEIEALTPGDVPNPDYTYSETIGDAVDQTFTPVAGVKTHSLTITNKAGEDVAWFDLVLTEGVTDLSGEYVSTEYAHEDHTCGNGYDLSAYGWGVGGCRYLKDGNLVLIEVGEKVNVVKLAEGIYEISGNGYDFIIGAPGAGGDAPEYTISETIGDAVDETFTPVAGVKTHSLALTKDGESEPSAWFDLVLTEGVTDLSGEYVSTEYAHEDHTCGNGYDLSAYGWGVGGCRYMKDGALVLIEVGAKVTVTAVSGGVYKFSGEGFEFVGEIFK